MLVPKPVRQICYMIIGLQLSLGLSLVLATWIGFWGYVIGFLLFPIFNIIGGIPIDAFDFWLRRRTRDPIWLMTDEGREWLDSDEGRAWQERDH